MTQVAGGGAHTQAQAGPAELLQSRATLHFTGLHDKNLYCNQRYISYKKTRSKKVKITQKYFEVLLRTHSYMNIYKGWNLLNNNNFGGIFVGKH